MRTTAAQLLAPAVGCRVVTTTRAGARLACDDGWSAAALLAALVAFDRELPGVRAVAAYLANDRPTPLVYAARVHAWMLANVVFTPEEGERFVSPDLLLAGREPGDCDDHARAVAALLDAAGVPSRLVVLARGGRPSHVTAQALAGGRWIWLETTVAARLDEHPWAAAVRTHATRRDIADSPEEIIMPRPSPEQIRTWQEALRRLGYSLPVDGNRDGEATRAAVRGFQQNANVTDAAGLVVDGILGPATGAALARLAPPATQRDGTLGAVDVYAGLPPGIDRKFCEVLLEQCEDHGCSPETALFVFEHESGINTTGYAEVKTADKTVTKAGGLNMFIRPPDGFPGTVAEFSRLTPAEQLPWIFRFWRPLRGIDDPTTYLQYNFLPASLARGKSSDDVVVCARGGTGYGGKEDFFYRSNAAMDLDRDGKITRGDLRRSLRRSGRFERVLAAVKATPKPADPSLLPPALALPLLVAGALKASVALAHIL